jgi:hypothetical protein
MESNNDWASKKGAIYMITYMFFLNGINTKIIIILKVD